MSSSSDECTDALSRKEPFLLSAMDPGATTGLALFKITPETYTVLDYRVVEYNVEARTTPLMVLKDWADTHIGLPHFMVYEDFHIRPGKRSVDTTALNIIGGMEHWIMESSPYVRVVPQEPVQGKHLVTDDVLKRCGLYVRDNAESRHVRDSMRHAVTYLQQIGYLPICRMGWPSTSVESPA